MKPQWRAASSVWRMLSRVVPAAHVREIAVWYNSGGKEIPVRHLSFGDEASFSRFLNEPNGPYRLDIGAAYAIPPCFEGFYPKGANFVSYAELRFDVDSDDYDSKADSKKRRHRSCCDGEKICESCWRLMSLGCCFIDAGLRQLGAKKLLWCFSGRRGMHCWTLDPMGTAVPPNQDARRIVKERVAPSVGNSFLNRYFATGDPLALEFAASILPPTRGAIPLPAKLSRPAMPFEGKCGCAAGTQAPNSCPVHFDAERGIFLGWFADRYPDLLVEAVKDRIEANGLADDGGARGLLNVLAGLAQDVRVVCEALAAQRAARPTADLGVRAIAAGNAGLLASARRLDDAFRTIAAATASEAPKVLGPQSDGRQKSAAKAVIEAALDCLAPRVDVPVTITPERLLKAPVTVHPASRKLALMVLLEEMLKFTPFVGVPTLLPNGEFDDPNLAEKCFQNFDRFVSTE